MRRITPRWAVCVALTAALAHAALPEPPQQQARWVPPPSQSIPEYVVRAAGLLFEARLADPRGGEYRQVEVVFSPPGKDSQITHAWVFEGGYAVCWDGMVYRVRSAGPLASLETDVRAIARDLTEPSADAAFWSGLKRSQPILPMSISLLLRLGRSDLAGLLWRSPEEPLFPGLRATRGSSEKAWLADAATAWLASAYLRLIATFEAGGDQEATDVAESLLAWQSRLGALGVRFEDRFLAPVPAVLADARRRLGDSRMPDSAVGALIHRLQDVRGGKFSIPGPLVVAFDPVYEELVRQGDAAVDALLDTWESDTRLTRSFDYSRPWSRERTPLAVHEVARMILADILGNSFTVRDANPSRLRAWWREQRGGSALERRLAVLADDSAAPEQWAESARFLTMRSDVEARGDLQFGRAGACDPAKPAPPMHGEPLRVRDGSRIGALLARRTAALAGRESSLACAVAVAAVVWDPATAAAAVRTAASLRACRSDALLTVARLAIGDTQAAADWASAIREQVQSPFFGARDLSPLWMFPDDPVLQNLADWLFAARGARLSPAVERNFIRSGLLMLPVYRAAVAAALRDARVVGSAKRSASGDISYHVEDGTYGASFGGRDGPQGAAHGEEQPIRVKDLVASELAGIEGAPKFRLDWRPAEKDGAVAEFLHFLETEGPRLRAFPARIRDAGCPAPQRVFLPGNRASGR